jgi:hypothetical protein
MIVGLARARLVLAAIAVASSAAAQGTTPMAVAELQYQTVRALKDAMDVARARRDRARLRRRAAAARGTAARG